jgi:hypothetical protein
LGCASHVRAVSREDGITDKGVKVLQRADEQLGLPFARIVTASLITAHVLHDITPMEVIDDTPPRIPTAREW